jgi:Ras-related protein Rab-1A
MAASCVDELSVEASHMLKVLLIGDSGTGKSNLLLRFADDCYKEDLGSTIGVDFKVCTRKVDDKLAKIYLWDTAGQERFRTITSSYYRGSHGIIVVYDVTDRESFKRVPMWVQEVGKYAGSTQIVLVGNKVDLVSKRLVTTDEGQQLAEELEVCFAETSALNSHNVEHAFGMLLRGALATAKEKEESRRQRLRLEPGSPSAPATWGACCA